MADYEYKVVRFTTTDQDTADDIIADEAVNGWEYWDNVVSHQGFVELIFRRDTQNQQ